MANGEKILTEQHIEDAKPDLILGPAYFASRDFMDKYMLGLDDVDLAPQVKKFTDALYEKVMDDFQNWLISNARSNVHDFIWRTVDEIVSGILSGQKWTVDKYALLARYDAVEIRRKICEQFPEEILAARVVDLEKKNADLTEQLRRYRS